MTNTEAKEGVNNGEKRNRTGSGGAVRDGLLRQRARELGAHRPREHRAARDLHQQKQQKKHGHRQNTKRGENWNTTVQSKRRATQWSHYLRKLDIEEGQDQWNWDFPFTRSQ